MAAGMRNPASVAVDGAGNVFISDPYNGRIRMVNPSGIINTITGSGVRSSTGEGVLATTATLGGVTSGGYGLAIGPNGSVYLADTLGETGRKLAPNVASQLKIVSGNNQSAAVGTQLPDPLRQSRRNGCHQVAGAADLSRRLGRRRMPPAGSADWQATRPAANAR